GPNHIYYSLPLPILFPTSSSNRTFYLFVAQPGMYPMDSTSSTTTGFQTPNAETDSKSLARVNTPPPEYESGSSQGQMSRAAGMPQPAREVDYAVPGPRGWWILDFFESKLWYTIRPILSYFIPLVFPHQPQQNDSKRIANAEAVPTAPTAPTAPKPAPTESTASTYSVNMGSNNKHSGNVSNNNNSTFYRDVGTMYNNSGQSKSYAQGGTFNNSGNMS
ncbi:hypothetical protein HOY82DRAFT_649164, partial [Tuber indicum]